MKNTKRITSKILFILLVIVIISNFILDKTVQADSKEKTSKAMNKIGGILLEPTCDFIIALGDIVLYTMQTSFLVEQPITVEANSDEQSNWSWGGTAGIVLGGLGVIIGAALCATGIGAAAGAGIIGAGASAISAIGIGAAATVGGVVVGVKGTKDLAQGLSGDYDLPFIYYTPYMIFSGNIPIFDINFFSNENTTVETIKNTTGQSDEEYEIVSESSAWILKPIVSGGYYALRNLAIVAMLSILLYVGVRMMLTSVASEKAKYKQMFFDWLIGICLIIMMHYIMVFIVTMAENISGFFSSQCIDNIVVDLPVDTTIDGQSLTPGESGYPQWICSFSGYARLLAKGFRENHTMQAVEYTLIYAVLAIYTLVFTVIYLKRVLYMAFLTMISPLVAMTYPIDKLNDGQAQGFNKWLKEYIFNALLQPMHLMLYTILVGSVMQLAEKYPIYALVALGFMIPAEKMLRNMFGFEKASSPETMGTMAMATTGMIMSGINKLIHKPKDIHSGKDEKNSKQNKINMKGDKFDTLETYANENVANTPFISNSSEQEGADRSLIEDKNTNNQQNFDFINPEENNSQEDAETRVNEELPWNRKNNLNNETENNRYHNIPDTNTSLYSDNTNEPSRRLDYSNGNTQRNYTNMNNDKIKPKRKIKSRLKNGMMSVGTRYQNKLKNAHPVKALRRGITYGFGAATLGMLGLAAGIASGDLGKTGQYTLAAGHVGGTMTKKMGDKTASEGEKNKEAFKQGWYGEEWQDKVREKKIKELQRDPDNIQYLRERDDHYKEILQEAYPEYARNGCYEIEDFYAAYQLEKAGSSRQSAISTYKLAKRVGDITTSPDAEEKWKKRLNKEFANTEQVNKLYEQEYKKIEEQYKEQEKDIQDEYEKQYRQAMYESSKSQEYKELKNNQKIETEKLNKDYEKQYNKILKDAQLEREEKMKSLNKEYEIKINKVADNQKKEELAKEYEQKRDRLVDKNTQNRNKKHEELQREFSQNKNRLDKKYKTKFGNINLQPNEQEELQKIEKQKDNRLDQLQKNRKEREERIEEIPIRFSESALENVKQFYANKEG